MNICSSTNPRSPAFICMLASSVVAITATAIAIIFLTKGYSQHLTGLVSSSSVGVVALAVLAVASIKSRQNPSSTLLTSSTSNSPQESIVSSSPAASSSHSRTEEGASANITADPPAHSSSDSQPPTGPYVFPIPLSDDMVASDNDEDVFQSSPPSPLPLHENADPSSATFAPIQSEPFADSEASLPLPSGGNSQPIPVTSTSSSPLPPAASAPLELVNAFGGADDVDTMTFDACKLRITEQVSALLILLGSQRVATPLQLPCLEESICRKISTLFTPMMNKALTPSSLLSYVRSKTTPTIRLMSTASILMLPEAVDEKGEYLIGGSGWGGGALRTLVGGALNLALGCNPSVQTMLGALNNKNIPEELIPKGPAREFAAHLLTQLRQEKPLSCLGKFLQPLFNAYIAEFEACYTANKQLDANRKKDELDDNRKLLMEKLARIVTKHMNLILQAFQNMPKLSSSLPAATG